MKDFILALVIVGTGEFNWGGRSPDEGPLSATATQMLVLISQVHPPLYVNKTRGFSSIGSYPVPASMLTKPRCTLAGAIEVIPSMIGQIVFAITRI